MDITTHEESGVTILHLEGLLDSKTAIKFNALVQELVSQGKVVMLVNLAKLEYISSAGLREILGLSKAIKKSNGKLGFCNVQSNVLEVFTISGFNTILNLYETHDLAMASLQPS